MEKDCIKVLSLFSGIGAFEKALDNLEIDYELVNFCEFDKYAVKSYCSIHNVEESKNLGDITKVDEKTLPKNIDLITYGFPCQDISLAGKQKGLFNDDGTQTRSGLFFEALRIIEETKPRVAIAENVKNLTSKKFNAQFQIILASLEAAGYNNYFQVLNAKDYGVPQNRERVFIVSIRKDVDTGAFRFPEGFPLELRLKDMLEDEVDEKFYLSQNGVNFILAEKRVGKYTQILDISSDIARSAITAKGNANWTGNFIAEPKCIQVAQMYGTDREPNPQAGRVFDANGISPTMDTCSGGNRMPKVLVCEATKKGYEEAVVEPQVLRQVRTEYGKGIRKSYESGDTQEKWGNMRQFEPRSDGVANTLSTVQKDNYLVESVAFDEQNQYIRKDGCVGTIMTDGSSPKKNSRVIQQDLRIRKLTPKECFRLMGFDDESFHRAEAVNSNTQLYKQAGNSIVVPVVEYLFKDLIEAKIL